MKWWGNENLHEAVEYNRRMEITFHSNGNVSQQYYSVLLSCVLNGEELLFFESWIKYKCERENQYLWVVVVENENDFSGKAFFFFNHLKFLTYSDVDAPIQYLY